MAADAREVPRRPGGVCGQRCEVTLLGVVVLRGIFVHGYVDRAQHARVPQRVASSIAAARDRRPARSRSGIGYRRGLLRHLRNREARLDLHIASFGVELSQEQRHQAALAAAIGPDNTDLLRCEDRQVYVVQQALRAALQGYGTQGDHGTGKYRDPRVTAQQHVQTARRANDCRLGPRNPLR